MKFTLSVVMVLASLPLLSAQTVSGSDADKARVFITDSQSWSSGGAGLGVNGVFGGLSSGGSHSQTAEIIKTFGERCPQVITNDRQDRSDYVVVLNHSGGTSWIGHKNKIAVFNRGSGDSVMSKSTMSLGGAVQEACQAINRDWAAHGKEIRAAQPVFVRHVPPSGLIPLGGQRLPHTPYLLNHAQLRVSSTPDGADIEVDGNFVGNTPSNVGVETGQHQISVKKTGYKVWQRTITVSSGVITLNATLEAEAK